MIEDRLIALGTSLLVILLVAGLTHLSAVLILPDVATKDAFHLLTPHGTVNKMVLLPAPRPGGDVIPFRDPATVQGICFFDLDKAPVRIRTRTEEGRLLMLSFRTPQGKVFYSMTDRAALRGAIDIRLVTPAQLEAVEDSDDDDAALPTELRLKSPTRKGLIVATALVARPSEAQEAEAEIKAVSCTPEPLPPPPQG